MYKQAPFNWDGSHAAYVIHVADNAFIPFNPDNTDYQQYLKWLEAGNAPEPAEEQQ